MFSGLVGEFLFDDAWQRYGAASWRSAQIAIRDKFLSIVLKIGPRAQHEQAPVLVGASARNGAAVIVVQGRAEEDANGRGHPRAFSTPHNVGGVLARYARTRARRRTRRRRRASQSSSITPTPTTTTTLSRRRTYLLAIASGSIAAITRLSPRLARRDATAW